MEESVLGIVAAVLSLLSELFFFRGAVELGTRH